MSRVLPWVAGLAAIVLTASGEYALYVACGFGTGWAAAGPVCIDAYVLAAIHARREVFFAVLVMVGTNATAHLLPAGGPPVPVVVAVSALAPVVLWRVHALAAGSVRQADGTVAETATVDDPFFTLTREEADGPATLTTDEGAWLTPWEGEPWPVASSPVPAELAARTGPAAVMLPVADAKGVHTMDTPRGVRGGYQGGDQTGDREVTAAVVTEVVTDEKGLHSVETPAGDQSGYQGGDQLSDRGPVAEAVTGVVSEAAGEPEGVSSSGTPAGDGEGDQPDGHGTVPEVVTGDVPTADTNSDDVSSPDPMSEAEVRRAARALNQRTVKATGRPVTITALRGELGLSRRAATELRRHLVATSA